MGRQIKTLKDMREVAPMFGPVAVQFVEDKILESPAGEDEEVVADDTQVMFLLLSLNDESLILGHEPVM